MIQLPFYKMGNVLLIVLEVHSHQCGTSARKLIQNFILINNVFNLISINPRHVAAMSQLL